VTGRHPGWPWRAARYAILTADLISLYAGLTLAGAARYDGALDQISTTGLLVCCLVAAVAFLLQR
jgi:hypothetical protein